MKIAYKNRGWKEAWMLAYLHMLFLFFLFFILKSLEPIWKRDQFEIEMFKKQKVEVTDCPSLSERLSIMSKFVMYNQEKKI